MQDTKIPITVGIIGHLDAEITDQHKKIIREIFNSISTKYPNSPVVLFSQLAKGADTEIAKIFIDIKKDTNRDYHLIVPLPFDEEEYIKDFNKNQLKDYNDLISVASKKFVLKSEQQPKEKLYRNGGKFVADSSIILIALWDKKENNKIGGTADIVKYKIEGSFDGKIANQIFDLNGSLIQIECNRKKDKIKKQFLLKKNYLESLLQDKSINKALQKIEKFNQKFDEINHEEINKTCDNFYPNEKQLSASNKILKKLHCLTDIIAFDEHKEYNKWINFFFIFGLIILVVFELYKHTGLSFWLFATTLILIFSALIIYDEVKKKDTHKQFIEDRIIAESLRIQFFWNISDINKSASNHILRIHKTEYNWIKHILSSIFGYTYNEIKHRDETIKDVKKYWILDQKNWFSDKIIKHREKLHNYNKYSKYAFKAGIFLLIFTFLLKFTNINEFWIHLLIVFDSVIFGIYALLKAYIEKQGFKQIENQYTLMKSVYESTENKMDDIEKRKIPRNLKDQQIDKLLFLTGKEALIENGNWYLILKDKDPEVEGLGG